MEPTLRRSHSEPPKFLPCRNTELLILKAFGVMPGIDEVGPGKKFLDGGALRGCCSPRLTARAMENVDIDSHAGKMNVVDVRPPITGILPFESPSFSVRTQNTHIDLQQGARRRSLQDFEKTLEAERYATLLGRPQTRANKDLEGFDFSLKQARKPKQILRDFKVGSRKDSLGWSVESTSVGDVSESQFDMSSQSSHTEESETLQPQAINKTFIKSEDCPVRMPLGLRRVLASLVPDTHQAPGSVPKGLDRFVDEAKNMQAFQNPKRVQTKQAHKFAPAAREMYKTGK